MNVSVFVVDNDKAIRTLLARLLEDIGAGPIVEAADGDEALVQCDENDFDLVLLDWETPGSKGPEVLQAIRAKNPKTQIVILSAEAQKAQVLRAVEAGAAGYILKPFEPDPVRDKLQSLCQTIVTQRRAANYCIGPIMTTQVVTIREDATVRQAIELLLKHRISGLPVVDSDDRLAGIITEYQLIQALFRPEVSGEPVGQFMTVDVVSVDERALLFQVANLLIKHRMRRVPVVRDGRVVGVIARRDLLRYMIEHEEELTEFLDSLKVKRQPEAVAV